MDLKHYKELCRACDAPPDGVFSVAPEMHELRQRADKLVKDIDAFKALPKQTKAIGYVIKMLELKFKKL